MSPSREIATRLLSIDAGVPTVEIFIIDGDNTVRARGVRQIQKELPVGIYKARFRIGNTVSDKLFELPVGVGAYTPSDLPAVPLSSPVPLAAPGNPSGPSAAGVAEKGGTRVNVSPGNGSGIFIFVDAPADPSPPITADAVTVHTFEGTKIASLAQGPSGQ